MICYHPCRHILNNSFPFCEIVLCLLKKVEEDFYSKFFWGDKDIHFTLPLFFHPWIRSMDNFVCPAGSTSKQRLILHILSWNVFAASQFYNRFVFKLEADTKPDKVFFSKCLQQHLCTISRAFPAFYQCEDYERIIAQLYSSGYSSPTETSPIGFAEDLLWIIVAVGSSYQWCIYKLVSGNPISNGLFISMTPTFSLRHCKLLINSL